MATSATSAVYIHVIEDVINKVREEFVNDGGPGEGVLDELQGIWEMKMMQARVICAPIDRNGGNSKAPGGSTPVGDLNVPYEATEEYETPTAEILFPPTPLQTPIPTPLPGTADSAATPVQTPYNIPTGNSDYTSASDNGNVTETKVGRPSPFMPPPSPWINQRPALGVDVNVAYVEAREEADRGPTHQPLTQELFMAPSVKRKREDLAPQYRNGGYIPQQDGAGDSTSQECHGSSSLTKNDTVSKGNREMATWAVGSSSSMPQLDGPATDPYDDGLSTPNTYNYQTVATEDYNTVNTPAPNDLQAGTPAPLCVQNDVADDDNDDDSEPSLNENDDDDFDDVDTGDDLNTADLVLAQFDKVTRTKSRWKCTLKDGIMHLNNRDVLFNKATGEFEF